MYAHVGGRPLRIGIYRKEHGGYRLKQQIGFGRVKARRNQVNFNYRTEYKLTQKYTHRTLDIAVLGQSTVHLKYSESCLFLLIL